MLEDRKVFYKSQCSSSFSLSHLLSQEPRPQLLGVLSLPSEVVGVGGDRMAMARSPGCVPGKPAPCAWLPVRSQASAPILTATLHRGRDVIPGRVSVASRMKKGVSPFSLHKLDNTWYVLVILGALHEEGWRETRTSSEERVPGTLWRRNEGTRERWGSKDSLPTGLFRGQKKLD